MVKTRYKKADPNHMAEVGPVGPDGREIPVSLEHNWFDANIWHANTWQANNWQYQKLPIIGNFL